MTSFDLPGGRPPEPGPSSLVLSPFILAVEVGTDPGGELAVAVAARYVERLSLVIVDPASVVSIRHLLDHFERADVAVAGSSSSLRAVRAVTSTYPYLIGWANHGPLIDLGAALNDDPALAGRLNSTVAARTIGSGAPVVRRLRTPSEDHRDPAAAWRAPLPPILVTADAGVLSSSVAPWLDRPQGTLPLSATLTVAAAMLRPSIAFEDATVTIDDAGGVHPTRDGQLVQLATSVSVPAFVGWVSRILRQDR
jgi:hypothetical protein